MYTLDWIVVLRVFMLAVPPPWWPASAPSLALLAPSAASLSGWAASCRPPRLASGPRTNPGPVSRPTSASPGQELLATPGRTWAPLWPESPADFGVPKKKKSMENYDLIRNHVNNSRWKLSKHGWKWCKRKETHWKCFERAQGHPLQCITETLEVNRKISTDSAEASAKAFNCNHPAKISIAHKNTL